MTFSLRQETTKTVLFMVLDIVMVFLFTFVWFRFIQKKTDTTAIKQSLWFTIFMQILFFVYYFIFDAVWDSKFYNTAS